MSDDQQAPTDAKPIWKTMKSKSGQEYRVMATKYNIVEQEETNSVFSADGPSFSDLTVNWAVGTSGEPTPDVQDRTAIIWYKLEKAELFSPFQYKLTIDTLDTYAYRFTDETNDTYTLSVWQTSGTHSMGYRSASPTIVRISGFRDKLW